MRKLSFYNFVSLNGCICGPGGDISWNKQHSLKEDTEFAEEGAGSGNTLLFGRITYQMMASFWPTPAAMEMMPGVAVGMNQAEKIVFSNTLERADWQNTQVVSGNIVEALRQLKATPGSDLTILGSGSIVTQFAAAGLIDEYLIMLNPVVVGGGTPIFNGLEGNIDLQLTDSRVFKSGAVLLTYRPL